MPDVPVVGVAGDGDFLMSIQELALAVQEGISVVYLVLNNIGWTSIRDFQRGMFGAERDFAVEFRRRRDGELVSPDFAAIATGFGASAFKVTELEQLRPRWKRRCAPRDRSSSRRCSRATRARRRASTPASGICRSRRISRPPDERHDDRLP